MTFLTNGAFRAPSARARAGSAARRAALAAVLALAGAAFAQDDAPAPAAPAASPSEPPFWARPKPQAPAAACQPEGTVAAPAPSRSPIIASGALAGAALLLSFMLWRRLVKAREETARERAATATPPAAPPEPEPAIEGLDARARARLRIAARTPPAAPAAAAPVEFEFTDPRNVEIELAEAGPGAEAENAKAFYGEIAASLQAALRREPARQDLRRKLLEMYFSAQQVTEFVNLAHEYLDQNNGLRDSFWPDIGAMGVQLAPDHEMFREFGAAPRSAAAPKRAVQLRRFHERNVDQGKLYAAQQALVADFQRLRADRAFQASLKQLLADSVRRPAPLTASPELAYVADGAQIFIKHEDRRRFHDDVMIAVTGQILLAQRLGRTRVVTATRDGIHGHAVAGAAARLGMESVICIAEADLNRYYGRALSMRRLGAHLRPIPVGAEAPDPRRVALDAWMDDPAKTQYVCGLTGGPSPFPEMVREFLGAIGRETAEQMRQMTDTLPAAVVASVCDGHMGLGMMHGLLEQTDVQLYCVEEKRIAGNQYEPSPAALLTRREHRWLRETGRVHYVNGDDHETLRIIEQFHATGTTLFAESARTMAHARALARRLDRRDAVVVLLTNQEGADFRSQRHDW